VALFPTRVLVALERSPAADAALEAAVSLAIATGSELHLLHVVVTSPSVRGRHLTPGQRDQLEVEGHALLDEGGRTVTELGGTVAASHLRAGTSVDRALEQAQDELEAGLLVVGASRSGSVARRLVGSSGGASVVRRATASILVVRPPAATS
jgi:nucleotide-binding universal stress UspA family protein